MPKQIPIWATHTNWRTDFDWTDPDDSPVSWSELETEMDQKRQEELFKVNLKDIKVEFTSRGFGTHDSIKTVRGVGTQLCPRTHAPELVIENPWKPGDTLVCLWQDHNTHPYTGRWVCDLDS